MWLTRYLLLALVPVAWTQGMVRGADSRTTSTSSGHAGVMVGELATLRIERKLAKNNSLEPVSVEAEEADGPDVPWPDNWLPEFGVATEYFRSELLFLHRSRAQSINVSMRDFENTVALRTDQLSFDFDAAARFTWTRECGVGRWVESSFLGLSSWGESRGTTSLSFDLVSPFDTGFGPGGFSFDAFDDAFHHQIQYSSDLYSAECNWGQEWELWPPCNGTLLVGCRYIGLHEGFEFLSRVDDLPGADQGIYDVSTNNHLVGFQVGGSAECTKNSRTSIALRAKVGLFANINEQESQVRNAGVLVQRASAANISLAALGEVAVIAQYRIAKNIDCRIGYEFTGVTGLALAPEQLDFFVGLGTQSGLNDRGHLFVHGPTIAIECSW